MGGLRRVGNGSRAEKSGHTLLNGEGNCLVLVAEEEHGVNLVPRLVGHNIVEDLGRLVLQLLDSLGASLGLNIVVEDLLGSLGVDVVAL